MCSINVVSAKPISISSESTQNVLPKKYTDFSGVWESVQCFVDTSFTINIQNDEYYFEVESELAEIGMMETRAKSGNELLSFKRPESIIESIEWNEGKTELFMRGVKVTKPINESPMISVFHHNTLSLNQEGQLLWKIQSIELKDLKQVNEGELNTCVFNKISEPNLSSKSNFKKSFRK